MSDIPRAVLDTDPRTEADHIGYLRYEAPDGRIDVICVTDGPSFERNPGAPKYEKDPVWHVEVTDTQLTISPGIQSRGSLIVSPSIDIKDRYHTSGEVVFARVDSL